MSSLSTPVAGTADVLIVGAGPTGLLLAGDLAAAGVRVTVLEKRARQSNLTRAFAVHARTLELLDARSLAEELIATGPFVSSLRVAGRARLDLGALPSRFAGVLFTPQYETERLLERRAREHGAEIRRATEVVGLRQDATGVEAEVRTSGAAPRDADAAVYDDPYGGAHGAPDPAGEETASTELLRADWLVGADGVHSTVRRLIGMPFPGRAVLRSVMLADVRLKTEPEELPSVRSVAEGIAFIVPFGDGWYRVIAWRRGSDLPSSAPVDLEELRAVVKAAFGTDYGLHDPRWLSRFHSDERQVPRYRDGRILLAGDAAHVHSPAGGLGMNAGLQDAVNLGWKLAAVVQMRADETLLDSYHAERHPVGQLVLRLSGAIVRTALLGSSLSRGVASAAGLAARVAPPLGRRAALLVSGLSVGYPAPPGAHPLVGRRAPDLPLAETAGGPTRLYEALRAGTYVRVLPRGGHAPEETGVTTVTRADARTTALLVRPDGYVAEATEAPTAPGTTGTPGTMP
ncbi:FAD-dependent monooxygenase [Streptomyces gamaensis]|uniref:FAD-dependent monooxygenase n=1 Tax=Streptomyces gamaensis TaxID=1763542 RepID=A0ABW0Z9S7_9ACTN